MYLGYECTLLCLLDFIIEYPHLTSGLVHPAHQLADCCIIRLHLHTHTQMCPIHLHTQNDLLSSPKLTQRCVLFTYTHKMICRLHLNSQNDLLNSTTTKHTNICRLHLHTHKDVSYSPTHTKWFVVFTQQNLIVILNNVNSLSSSLTHIDVVFNNIHATICHPHQNKNWLIDFT